MRGLAWLVASLIVLAVSIVLTVLFAESRPIVLVMTVPGMIISFFGILVPLMWLLSRIGLPTPAAGVAPVDVAELRRGLLALADEHSPFSVSQKNGVIVCAWKLADARWFEFFSKVHLEQDYQLQLLPMEETHTVRAIEITKRSHRRVGLGHFSAGRVGFRGWSFAIQKEAAVGVTELFPPRVGTLYAIDFRPQLFRKPMLELIASKGWTIQPCTLLLRWGI